MASIVQFVDSIASSPTVRCDLNARAQGLMVNIAGVDLSPPPLRRTVVSTMMTDGEIIPASAYGNRTLKLPLKLLTSTFDAGATILQNLAHELIRPNNILKVQLEGATSPVFFRTFAAPDYVVSMLRLMLTENTDVELTIPAEPFAYGLKETINAVTVTEDPAAGGNAMFWDITGVKGDVETPVNLVLPTGNLYDSGDPISVLAIRRRGTVANTPFVLQGEAFSNLGTDTTLPGNDATMSGSSSNYARVSFSTNITMTRRLWIDPYPTSASVDNRGTYRVFACLRRSSVSGSVNVQLGYTSGTAGILVQNDAVTVPLVTARQHVDLGLITYPTGLDPVHDGYSNVEYPVRGRYLEVRAERPSGSSTLDFDYLLFVPADDNLMLVDWGDAILTTNEFVIDSVHEIVFTQNTPQDQVYGSKASSVMGGFPTISPDTTNRMYFIRRTARGATVTKSETTAIEAQYWPRYLFVRPATT
jgi:hypothetical protein